MRLLNVRKKRPLNVRKMRLLTKCFAPICWIANYSEDNVNHPSNNQGQVFWTQRRQYCYVVLSVPFLLGWLFGSVSSRFLYTHPATTDPKKDKSMYFLQAIKQITPIRTGFGSKACENLWAVLREKLRQRCLKKKHIPLTIAFYEHLTVAFYEHSIVAIYQHLTVAFYEHLTVAFYEHLTVACYKHITVAFTNIKRLLLRTFNSCILRTFNRRILRTLNGRLYEH